MGKSRTTHHITPSGIKATTKFCVDLEVTEGVMLMIKGARFTTHLDDVARRQSQRLKMSSASATSH